MLQLYMLVHIVPSGLEFLSSRREAQLLPQAATNVCLYPDENLSFMFYTGHYTAPVISKRDTAAFENLTAELNSSRPIWCFVSGQKYLKKLQQAVPAVKIIDSRNDNFLVTNSSGTTLSQNAVQPLKNVEK